MDHINHAKYMNEALNQEKKGLSEGGIPIGAVLVKDGEIIGRGHNRRIQKNDSILHAEMDCIENAGRMNSHDYHKCMLYSTLSPCEMCTGAILLYKIPIVIIGENENFKGPEEYMKRRGVHLINLDERKCRNLLKKFIKENHNLWYEDIGK